MEKGVDFFKKFSTVIGLWGERDNHYSMETTSTVIDLSVHKEEIGDNDIEKYELFYSQKNGCFRNILPQW